MVYKHINPFWPDLHSVCPDLGKIFLRLSIRNYRKGKFSKCSLKNPHFFEVASEKIYSGSKILGKN